MKTYKKGISLIVLVITIIVLAILASAVIITLSNANIIQNANMATFTSDMQSYKEAFELYVASEMAGQKEDFNRTEDITTEGFKNYLGDNLKDKYADGLKVIEGKLVYETDDPTLKSVVQKLGMVNPIIEALQKQYEFKYYSTVSKALSDANNSTTDNKDADADTAVAALYVDEDDGYNLVLLRDTSESVALNVTNDLNINLNGKNLNFTTSEGALVIGDGTAVTIDGKVYGSSITMDTDSGTLAKMIKAENSENSGTELTLDGGTYKVSGSYSTAAIAVALKNSSLIAENCNFYVTNSKYITKKEAARGIQGGVGCVQEYTNCHIVVDSPSKDSGIGITNKGTLTFNSGYVQGIHSGIQTTDASTTKVYGGEFVAAVHGGFYFANSGGVYVENSIIRNRGVAISSYEHAEAGYVAPFYLRKNAEEEVTTVYMDNCELTSHGDFGPALAGDLTELYISNSTLYTEGTTTTLDFRVDYGSTLYLGENVEHAGTYRHNTTNLGTVEETGASYKQ